MEQLGPRTLLAGQGRADLGSHDMASRVLQCLYSCVSDAELQAQRDSGERQMELLLCGMTPARLFAVGWRAVWMDEVGREALRAAVPEE